MYSIKEKIFLCVVSLLGVASLIFFLNFKHLAFPEHNIDLKISRDQAQEKSFQKARELGLELSEYKKVTIFDIEDLSKTYLERNMGVAKTADLAQDIDIWHFSTRFYKPLEKTEYTLSFSPSGRFVGLSSEIEENAPGAKLKPEEAQVVVLNFLKMQSGFQPEDWTLVSSDAITRPNRIDHVFTWEKNDFKTFEATYRIEVVAMGERVGSYNEFLKVPDKWQRGYALERSDNEIAQAFAEVLTFVFFGISIIYTFITGFRLNNLRMKFALKVAFSVGIVAFLASINELPIVLYAYPTTQSYTAFLATVVFGSLSSGMLLGLLIFLVTAAGEMLYRQAFKQEMLLEKILPYGIFTKQANKSFLVGFFAGCIFLFYVVFYYIAGQKFRFWVPADINYSNIFNTYIPWIYPLLIGLSAAVLEEGIFRLFGITFLKKYLKSNFLVVLITSVIWAFLHSSYPQSPWFARGVEISLVGFVLGFLYLRYGIMASISAHYTFNALQTAIFFYSSNNLYVSVTSVLIAVLPLIIGVAGIVMYFKNGKFSDYSQLINAFHKIQGTPGKIINEIVENETVYMAHSSGRQKFTVLLAAILTVCAIIAVSLMPSGTLTQVISRKEALKIAQDKLLEKNINISEYHSVVVFSGNEIDKLTKKYILENSDNKTLSKIYPAQIPLDFWSVRFFKPLEKNEYRVYLLPNGQFNSLNFVLDEKEVGKNLNLDEAVILANKELSAHSLNPLDYSLVESNIDKKEFRTDYFLTFENHQTKINQATYRVNINIFGDVTSGFDQYIKLPEDFVRSNNTVTTKDIAAEIFLAVAIGSLLLLSVIAFLNLYRHHKIIFSKVLTYTLFFTTVFALSEVNSFSLFYSSYNTAIPLLTYQVQNSVIMLFSVLIYFLFFIITLSTFAALWKKLVGPIFPLNERYNYLKDAIISAYLSLFILIPIIAIIDYIFFITNYSVNFSDVGLNVGFDSYLPGLVGISELASAGIIFLIIAICTLSVYQKLMSWRKVLFILASLLAASSLIGAGSAKEYLQNLLELSVGAVPALVVVIFVLRGNLFAYLISIYIAMTLSFGMILLTQTQSAFYILNGAILVIVSFLPLISCIVLGLNAKLRKLVLRN